MSECKYVKGLECSQADRLKIYSDAVRLLCRKQYWLDYIGTGARSHALSPRNVWHQMLAIDGAFGETKHKIK